MAEELTLLLVLNRSGAVNENDNVVSILTLTILLDTFCKILLFSLALIHVTA